MDIHSVISGPGVYTHILKDLVNGCVTVKTITVSTISGFPSFNTSSTTNYMLGCSPLNQSTLCAINAITSSSVSPQFALLPPGSPSTIPLPSSAFNLNNCNTISTPGAYTLVVYDQANACQTAQQVNIFQNTAPPHLAVSMISQTLTCFNPTILATGSSTTSGAVLSWMVPSTPPVVPSPTVIVGPTTGPAPSTVATSYATYTAIATNTLNACVAQTTVLISQNFKIPTPFMAVGNPSVIGCNNVPVLLSYTNNAANSGIPGAVAIVISWMGPAPQASLAASSYSAYVAGVYTLTVQDNKNGCIGSITKVVPQNTSIVTGPAVYTMACTGTVEISPLIISGGSYSYTWTSTAGSGSFLTSVNSKSVTVNGGGTYYCSIYNNSTGCFTIDTVYVHTCVGLKDNSLNAANASIYPNPVKNYVMIDLPQLPVEVKLTVTDIQGRFIFSESLNERSNKIPLNLSKGIYFYDISEKGASVKRGKLLIE
jgi:hypothetical protein